jgi:hypothetical protein
MGSASVAKVCWDSAETNWGQAQGKGPVCLQPAQGPQSRFTEPFLLIFHGSAVRCRSKRQAMDPNNILPRPRAADVKPHSLPEMITANR